jgi:hypothetical protein
MTIWILLTIISVVALIIFITWGVISQWDSAPFVLAWVCGIIVAMVGFVAITQKMSIRSEMLRQTKERQQILHQIEHLDEKSDKVKLNEWILTYNDWVNDVNTSKELYGWFSWYAGTDMSEHAIIELV